MTGPYIDAIRSEKDCYQQADHVGAHEGTPPIAFTTASIAANEGQDTALYELAYRLHLVGDVNQNPTWPRPAPV